MATDLLPSFSRPIYRPLPPSKKVRYAKAMTVCIAGACREHNEPRIVMCADSRLSYGDLTSTDTFPKFDVIGRGWTVLMANRPDSAKELIERIKEWFRTTVRLDTTHAVLSAVKAAVNEFRHSPLYSKYCCELIVSGFVSSVPVLITVQADEKGHLSVAQQTSFAAIGSGASIASVILSCREYQYPISIQNATYLVYEAKRWSEKASGVGPLTMLVWQSLVLVIRRIKRAFLLSVKADCTLWKRCFTLQD